MKISLGLIGVILASCGSGNLFGQAEPGDFPPPKAPFVSAVPAKANWTITTRAPVTDGSTEKQASDFKPSVTRIESVRDGNLKRDKITYQSGSSEEIWYVPGYALTVNRSGKVRADALSSLDDDGTLVGVFRELGNAIKSPGYPGFKWLDQRHYAGVVLFDKVLPCYHYVLRDKHPDTGEEFVAAEAWINAQTGEPVAYSFGDYVYVYRFGGPAASATALALPPELETAHQKLKKLEERKKRLAADAAAQQ